MAYDYYSSDINIKYGKKSKTKMNMNVTHTVTQNKNLIEAIYHKDLIPIINLNQSSSKKLVVGQRYYIQGSSCDGLNMPIKQYEIVAIVKKFHNFDLNYVVVKQVGGERTTIFELPRNLCTDLGIDYEEHLQLLPMSMNWKLVTEEISDNNQEFDPNNLSTYPSQYGYVNYIILKLGGFSSYKPTHIITSNGTMMLTKDFIKNLCVTYRYDIDGDKKKVELGDNVKFDIITNEVSNPTMERRGCLCDENGYIYLRINLVGKNITNEMLNNLSAKDIFDIFWIETRNLAETKISSTFETIENAMNSLGVIVDIPTQHFTLRNTKVSDRDRGFRNGTIRVDDFGRMEKYINGYWKTVNYGEEDYD